MYIDAHCHLTDERVWEKAGLWLENAKGANVTKVRIGGLEPKEWDRQIELQHKFGNIIRTSFGLHPWWIEKFTRSEVETHLGILREKASVAQAIGETGLDFYEKRDPARFEDQIFAFREQIRIAKDHRLPLVLHIVKSHSEALKILKEEKALSLKMQVHSFSGSKEEANAWIKVGAYLSFSGTFLREKNSSLRETLKGVPLPQLLLETDAPDQSWRKDGRNEPALITEVYEKAAQVLDLKITSLTEIVAENFTRFG